MKVCVLLRAENDSTDVSKESLTPDFPAYIDANVHTIEIRKITQDRGIEDIDQLDEQGFDVYINYLFQKNAPSKDWIEVGKHLGLKAVPSIGALPASVLEALGDTSNGTAKGNTDKDSSGGPSESAQGLNGQSKTPRVSVYNTHEPDSGPGDFSVLVVQIGRTAVALTPIERRSPEAHEMHEGVPPDVDEAKVGSTLETEAEWQLVQDSDLVERLKTAAAQAFDSYRGAEYLAYMRVDLRVDSASGDVHAIRADPAPAIFYPRGTGPLDDLVIEETFPGGHQALFEVLLSTKLSEVPDFARRNQGCARQHDNAAGVYYKVLDSTNVTENRLGPFVGKYNYDGTVLDCCSGSGAFARYAVDKGVNAKYSAADYSIEMTKLPDSQALYEEAILIGPIQEVLMQASVHDHVVCFGSFHLFKPFDFVSALSQLFLRARKSVTFDVDDLSQTYIQGSAAAAGEKPWEKLDYNHNNIAAAVRFGVPHGWRATVYNEERFAYHSPLMKEDVYTRSYRFERV
ncbi:hypothetical protein F4859DRAFT_522405 [Xylaria cf. heliscus]|nr:hypothetical protein F4859DRAFT_522405 [Xylaria cf. heliscus]